MQECIGHNVLWLHAYLGPSADVTLQRRAVTLRQTAVCVVLLEGLHAIRRAAGCLYSCLHIRLASANSSLHICSRS